MTFVLNSRPPPKLEELSRAQLERLFHIDFKLRFLGSINRNDLISRFGIKAAAATRDISLYKYLAPKNLVYDTKAKSYMEADHFKPLFDYQGSQALPSICYGLGDGQLLGSTSLVPAESPTQLNFPKLDVVATITKAIHQKKALKIDYRSLSSGLSQREIVPFAVVDNGHRWHVRAFDRRRDRFADFVIGRIARPNLLSTGIAMAETKEADIQWNRMVEMHIVPHPNLKHPETIENEYGMTNGMLKIHVRAAVAGYVLRHWNIDCSSASRLLAGPEYHLWLRNRQTLYGVENLVIAPGYEPEASETG